MTSRNAHTDSSWESLPSLGPIAQFGTPLHPAVPSTSPKSNDDESEDETTPTGLPKATWEPLDHRPMTLAELQHASVELAPKPPERRTPESDAPVTAHPVPVRGTSVGAARRMGLLMLGLTAAVIGLAWLVSRFLPAPDPGPSPPPAIPAPALATDTMPAAPTRIVELAPVKIPPPAPAATVPAKSTAPGSRSAASSSSAELEPLDYSGAMSAVNAAGAVGAACGPEASGTVFAAVTFAPNGKATRAVIESGPLRGTPAGSCVARQLQQVTIPPFAGDDLATVRAPLLLR